MGPADGGHREMAENKLDYQKLTQNALRGVVRSALEIAARDGLPGEHHFFVAFSTGAPGVNISSRLRERYPEEMTIVLQHQFWGLEVFPERFQVKLSFNNTPETLVVPYAAVKGFLDPSVQFGLQFETGIGDRDGTATLPAVAAEAVNVQETPVEPTADETVLEENNTDDDAPTGVVSLDSFRKK